jgi:hypothetical protein
MKVKRLTKPIGIALYPADIAALDVISKRYRMGKSALIRLLVQREFSRLDQKLEEDQIAGEVYRGEKHEQNHQ